MQVPKRMNGLAKDGHGDAQFDQQDPAVKGSWRPLMDFAVRKGMSVSTLRRHIKSNKVAYRVEKGRYLIWDEAKNPESATLAEAVQKELQKDLQKANEEIAELKMLIALYEQGAKPDVGLE